MKRTPLDPRITWAVAHMQGWLHEPIHIPGLAARVNLSPSHFRHLFTAQTGMAPARFVWCLRLRRARLLIERTFLSIDEVMALVGYADRARFLRDFDRLHGGAPGALRGTGVATPMPAERMPSTAHELRRRPSKAPANKRTARPHPEAAGRSLSRVSVEKRH